MCETISKVLFVLGCILAMGGLSVFMLFATTILLYGAYLLCCDSLLCSCMIVPILLAGIMLFGSYVFENLSDRNNG